MSFVVSESDSCSSFLNIWQYIVRRERITRINLGNRNVILTKILSLAAVEVVQRASNAGSISISFHHHYIDAIMTTMVSQITSLTVVYSTVYSVADQRKHQSSTSLAFVCGIHRNRWIPPTKGQLRGKGFHLMTSSWLCILYITNGIMCLVLTNYQ